MRRPLADKRPVGPFAQSEAFNNQLLGGGSDDTVEDLMGDTIIVEIDKTGDDAMRILDDVVKGPLRDFVDLEVDGDYDGEVTVNRQNRQVKGMYYTVIDGDPEVTMGQIERFLSQELNTNVRVFTR